MAMRITFSFCFHANPRALSTTCDSEKASTDPNQTIDNWSIVPAVRQRRILFARAFHPFFPPSALCQERIISNNVMNKCLSSNFSLPFSLPVLCLILHSFSFSHRWEGEEKGNSSTRSCVAKIFSQLYTLWNWIEWRRDGFCERMEQT